MPFFDRKVNELWNANHVLSNKRRKIREIFFLYSTGISTHPSLMLNIKCNKYLNVNLKNKVHSPVKLDSYKRKNITRISLTNEFARNKRKFSFYLLMIMNP